MTYERDEADGFADARRLLTLCVEVARSLALCPRRPPISLQTKPQAVSSTRHRLLAFRSDEAKLKVMLS